MLLYRPVLQEGLPAVQLCGTADSRQQGRAGLKPIPSASEKA